MIKVLVIENPELNGVTLWRCLRPFSLMRKAYRGQIEFTFKVKGITFFDVDMADVVMVFRPTDRGTLDLLQKIKGRKPIIIDCDDDIFALPTSHPLYFEYTARAAQLREVFDLADWIWTSTKPLLYSLDALERGEVVPNAVLPEDLPDAPAPDRGFWVWRGTHVQVDDIMYAAPWYDRIKADAAKWLFWGYFPPYEHGPNVQAAAYSDAGLYLEALKRLQANVIWKPLRPGRFNDAKSNIAWIEATIAGGVCVTNYAGEPGWECAYEERPYSYHWACEQWKISCTEILEKYNLNNTAAQRFDRIKDLVG